MYLDDIKAYRPQSEAEEADKEQILYYVNLGGGGHESHCGSG